MDFFDFKCKYCGGKLENVEGMKRVGKCKYCGAKQTLPKLQDERRANLFDRANHFRRCNEFDKAETLYEQILNDDTEDPETYWSLVLCRFGIEYVEDAKTKERKPTINRLQLTSILADEDYKSAIKYADEEQKEIYEQDARAINEIQKEIIKISQAEEPFDVFICYKETDEQGKRTHDSVDATDLYYSLKDEGFKVFFSKITLENKLGTAYEPYIFAALNSAKVMVVLGSKPEYFNAVWVKNEWSRYLSLVKKSGGKKMLIPAYRDMSPYDLPEEFAHLQAQDMSKIGFVQDLVRGIRKVISPSGNVDALLKRAYIFLDDRDWDNASKYFNKVLDITPENENAYLGLLLYEHCICKKEQLKDLNEPFDGSKYFKRIEEYGSIELKTELAGYLKSIRGKLQSSHTQPQNQNTQPQNQNTQPQNKDTHYNVSTETKDSYQPQKATDKKRKANPRAAVLTVAVLLLVAIGACALYFSMNKPLEDADSVEEFTEDYYTYTVVDGKATIIHVDESIGEEPQLPLTLGGYTVTSIGDYAFEGCKDIGFVEIPSSITHIGKGAFRDCTALYLIIISPNVTAIKDRTFEGCSSLSEIKMYTDITDIGKYAFKDCLSLSDISYLGLEQEWNIINKNSLWDYNTGSYTVYCNDGEIIKDTESESTENTGENPSQPSVDDTESESTENTGESPSQPSVDTGYYTYTVDGGKATITDVDESISGNVTIPSVIDGYAVTGIDYAAFEDCTGLTSIIIPDSVTSIGHSAFSGCTGLTSVTISDNVTSIGGMAFCDCTGLVEVHISDIAAWCNIDFDDLSSNPLYYATYTTDIYINGDLITELVIPEGVTEIPDYAFCGLPSITSVTIPNTVTSIGDQAFYGCEGLTSIIISKGVTSIGEYAFYGCTRLTSITIPDSVTSIGASAFYNCTGIEKVYISDIAAWCNIDFGDYSFNPLYYVDNAKLYLNGDLITELVIPEGVTEIPDYAFKNQSSIISVTIPNTVTSIGNSAFRGCAELTSITIPDSVTSIGASAFYNCTGIEKVYISDIAAWCNIDFVGDYSNPLYYYAKNLYLNGKLITELVIPEGVIEIPDCAFKNQPSITSVTIPNTVTSISEDAFYDCKGLTSITIPDSVTSIGSYAFYGCTGLKEVHISDIAAWCNIDFGYDSNPLEYAKNLYLNGSLITELVIPEGVTEIPDYAFKNQSSIISVTIPSTVTSIGEDAFYSCTGLTSITIPDSVVNLSGFSGCTELTSVTIGNSVTIIGKSAFSGCIGLTSVTIPDSVTSIGEWAFYECTGLTSIAISDSVTEIGKSAFSGCIGLTSVTIPDSITYIGDYAFDDCTNLKYNEYDNAYYLGNENNPYVILMRAKNTSITSCEMNSNTKAIDAFAFKDCTRLTSIEIPNSVTSIGYNMFSGCTGLTSVTIGSGVTSISSSAFSGCTRLTSITIPDSVTSIGSYAFYNCTGLTSIKYNGTAAQWNSIEKSSNWVDAMQRYTVHCTDENISE